MFNRYVPQRRLTRLAFLLLIGCAILIIVYSPLLPTSRGRRIIIPATVVGESAGEPVTEAQPDQPDAALAFRHLRWQDESGYIPADGLVKAAQKVAIMRASQGPTNIAAAPHGAGIYPARWQWLGPGNVGGRIRSIVINPTLPTEMWVGSVSGGIWKSTDSGQSWLPVDDFMANLAVSTLVIQPNNPSIMYAGTGEGFYNRDGIQGAGVFKSVDGGNTWPQLTSTNNSDWYFVNRLAISADGQKVLAATRTGLWYTSNGGSYWSQATNIDTTDVSFNPSDNNQAVASGWHGNVWYSANGGLTWVPASHPSVTDGGRVEIAYAPGNPAIVYASVDNHSGEIWKSADGGQTYSLVHNDVLYLISQGWYNNSIWVDPTNANTIVVGGVGLFRSTDGGVSLSLIFDGIHPDQHAIVSDPGFNGNTNGTVYFGNDGGIYKTGNIYTATFDSSLQNLNHNLGITQFYGAAGNANTGVVIGGTQDNGTLRYSGGPETWGWMYGGDGGFAAADPVDPSYFYGETPYLMIHRSNDGGASAEYISGYYWQSSGSSSTAYWKPAPYTINDAQNGTANFIAPFILDPNDANRLLAGGLSLWRTTDAKTPNTNVSGPAWANIKPPTIDNSFISAVAVAPGNSNVIWVGHNNGDIYATANGTAILPTWTRVDLNTPSLPNRYVTQITFDPNDSNVVYATFGGFSPDNVWRSNDGGLNWSDVTGSEATGLPDVPINSVAINPQHSNWLYVGTEVGIFASENSGIDWFVPQDGPANVAVDELSWMNQILLAATYGRGVFETPTFIVNTEIFLPFVGR